MRIFPDNHSEIFTLPSVFLLDAALRMFVSSMKKAAEPYARFPR